MKLISICLLSLLLVATGCQKPQPEVPSKPASPAIEPTTPEKTETPSTSATESRPATTTVEESSTPKEAQDDTPPTALVVTAAPGTAEATFQEILVAFQEGRIDSVFDFLPASHQADVEKIVHRFAETMDREIWFKAFETLSKVANVMKSKKEMILDIDLIKRAPAVESIKSQWDGIAERMGMVATSEVCDIDYLKNSSFRVLLSSASDLLTGVKFPKFGNVTVTTIASTKDTATLSYRESKKGDPIQVEFVRVDDKWLPKSIADGWQPGIDNLDERLQTFPDRLAAAKPRIMQQLDSVGGILDKLQAAKSQEQVNLALMELRFSIWLGALSIQEAMQTATALPRKGNDIHVEFNRELKDEEQTQLAEAVKTQFQDVDYELVASGGKTRCRFTPVPKPEGLVEVLKKQFPESQVRFSSEKQTIFVESK